MIRSVRMADEDARVLQLAERYLGTLFAVERAHALDDQEAVTSILAAVDPVDVRIVRAHLHELWALFNRSPIRIGAEPSATPDGATPSPSPAAARDVGSSAPSSLHPVEFHPESRRV